MIITNWTMRRFHVASFLVLICARLAPCMPLAAPPPAATTPTESSQQAAAEQRSEPSSPPAAATVHVTGPEWERDAVGEEGQYFQGDIRLLPADDPYDLYQTVFKRMAFDRPGSGDMELDSNNLTARLWPNARVPYRFDTGLNMMYRHIFDQAIYEWERATCLNFEMIGDVNITEEDYIVFTNTKGCSSYVGRIGGMQEVSIDNGCAMKGHAMHEIGHALGLWHEHSRWDRDMYIRIVRENIKDNAYYNFGTISEDKWLHTEDLGYDLLSIMHYGAKSFSRNGEDTIEIVVSVPNCAVNKMGQRKMLSRKDKVKTSRMYQCENETNMQDKCPVNITTTTDSTPTPTPTPPSPSVTNRLFNNDYLRLSINSSQHESMHCTSTRCSRQQCDYNPISQIVSCGSGFDFSIHHFIQRRNQKIKTNDTIVLHSLHKSGRWVECNGQNICSISDCPANTGSINISNISECADQRFKLIATRNALRDGDVFKLKHETNETYLYCNTRWCDLLPECREGEVELDSTDSSEVLCHTPTTFYVKKLYR